MNKITKLLISFALLLFSASIFYYVVFYLPQKEKERTITQNLKEEQNQIEKCRQIGESLHQKELKENIYTVGTPEYKYSKKLKTCIYYNVVYTSKTAYVRSIIDSMTNQTIATYFFDTQGKDIWEFKMSDMDKLLFDKFEQKYKELFSNT